MKTMIKTLGALSLALGMTGGALAANGVYLGASIGQSTYQDGCDGASLFGLTSCDDNDTGWKIFGGYEFTENLAAEAAWVDLGEISASGPGGSANIEGDGFVIDLKATLPLNEQFGIFGKLGFIMWDLEASGVVTADDDGTDLAFGLGAQYMLTDQFGIVGEWERFDFDGDDADLLSIGAMMKF